MKILLIGSGGREHALAWKISASPLCDALVIAPGNAGTAACGENVPVDITDHAAVVALARAAKIDFAVVGPDAPIAAGLGDDLRAAGFKTFAPSAAAARLESSKAFTKEFCRAHGIPTGAFARFTDPAAARAHIYEKGAPIVVKADGLALGKGVVVAQTVEEAEGAVAMMFSGAFGRAGEEVVVEEYLDGEEMSFFALSDGTTAIPFGTAQDHKRAHDGDIGPNTGGMGAYSPAPMVTPALERQIMDTFILPTVRGMRARGTPFVGVLYLGLMMTAGGPKLIEYNARFGDPETQALMVRMKTDLVAALLAACDGVLKDFDVRWWDEAALTVVMATKGYPGVVKNGSQIKGIEVAEKRGDHITVFHAATRRDGPRLLANGGRVLNITATGKNVAEAQRRAYAAVDAIDWPEGFCRRDIGWRALKREDGA